MENKNDRDQLTGALIGLAKACDNNPKKETTDEVVIQGVFLSGEEAAKAEELQAMTEKVREEKFRVSPGCRYCQSPCGNTDDYDMENLWQEESVVREQKIRLLDGVRRLASLVYPHRKTKEISEKTTDFFYEALAVLGYEMEKEDLKPVLSSMEEILKNF